MGEGCDVGLLTVFDTIAMKAKLSGICGSQCHILQYS